jgi:hypothetical protein
MNTRGTVGLWFLAVAALAAGCCARGPEGGAAAAEDPLAAGWRFACAITNDAKDRAACQEAVAMAYVARGDCDRSLELSERIGDWRRGVVLAEIAAKLAEGGRTNEALERAAQAEAIGRGIQDWQKDLILVRVAKTKALLGKEAEVGRWRAFYRTNQDYRGEIAAYHALTLARDGQITNALAALDSLADSTHLDVSSWRAYGHLLLARDGHLNGEQTSHAFAQAWIASDKVPGAKRWDVKMDLAQTATACGETALARAWLNEVSSNLVPVAAAAGHLTAPALGRLAIRWGELKDAERVAACAQAAEPLIRQQQNIEQPGLVVLLGEAWARQGDTPRALAYYEHAMDLAGQLPNRRRRAISCVEICLSLERAGLRRPQAGKGLSRLLAGFGATHG